MAMTLRELRSGRVEILPQNICNKENRPSNVSFMRRVAGELYHRFLKSGKKIGAHCTGSSESSGKYFGPINLSTQVWISLWESLHLWRVTSRSSILFTALHNFRASNKNLPCGTKIKPFKNKFRKDKKFICGAGPRRRITRVSTT